jgi:hypothetical protein
MMSVERCLQSCVGDLRDDLKCSDEIEVSRFRGQLLPVKGVEYVMCLGNSLSIANRRARNSPMLPKTIIKTYVTSSSGESPVQGPSWQNR